MSVVAIILPASCPFRINFYFFFAAQFHSSVVVSFFEKGENAFEYLRTASAAFD